jgi:hypothetical protein
MNINDKGDGMKIQVSADPTMKFGADILPDGSESISDAVSLRTKKKKKKKVKGISSLDMSDQPPLELEQKIVEAKKEEEDDLEFTMIGDSKPKVKQEEDIEITGAMTAFTPFGGKRKAKKKKKVQLANFDELDNLEAFNIE